LDNWLALAGPPDVAGLSGPANDIRDVLLARGAMFPQELQRAAKLLPTHLEMGLADLIGHGALTCDSFAGLRQLIVPPSKRHRPIKPIGRWSLFRNQP